MMRTLLLAAVRAFVVLVAGNRSCARRMLRREGEVFLWHRHGGSLLYPRHGRVGRAAIQPPTADRIVGLATVMREH